MEMMPSDDAHILAELILRRASEDPHYRQEFKDILLGVLTDTDPTHEKFDGVLDCYRKLEEFFDER